jgi:hypothetical protein
MARRRGKYRVTPKRRAALRKAQLVSARKRRGKKIAIGAGIATAGVLGVVAARHISGSRARKNLLSSQSHAAASTMGSRTPGRDVVSRPPTVVARPNKLVKRRGPLYDSGDVSHLSSTAKKLYESYTQRDFIVEGQRKLKDSGGSAPSRAVHYIPTEENIRKNYATSSTNPFIRKIMKEGRKAALKKAGYR